jgi:hypothetical protein
MRGIPQRRPTEMEALMARDQGGFIRPTLRRVVKSLAYSPVQERTLAGSHDVTEKILLHYPILLFLHLHCPLLAAA